MIRTIDDALLVSFRRISKGCAKADDAYNSFVCGENDRNASHETETIHKPFESLNLCFSLARILSEKG